MSFIAAGLAKGLGEGLEQQRIDRFAEGTAIKNRAMALLNARKAERQRQEERQWALDDREDAQNHQVSMMDMKTDAAPPPKSYRTVTGEEAASMGLDGSKSYNVGSDGKVSSIGGGGTNVTVNSGNQGLPGLSKVPQGYSYVYGADGQPVMDERGVPKIAPINGSEADTKAKARDTAAAKSNSNKKRAADVVLQDIGRVRGMLEGGRFAPVTGVMGAAASLIDGTEASDARALTETIKANIGFDRLQQMRESSPTGGALGNVTERELATLQAVLGSLEYSQSKEQLTFNLNRLEDIYQTIMDKAAAYPNAAQFGFDGSPQTSGSSTVSDEALLEKYGG
ncbi:MAG: hypothetical protein AAF737_06870 [Pseudomonadota bacterium]